MQTSPLTVQSAGPRHSEGTHRPPMQSSPVAHGVFGPQVDVGWQ
jgi:hypothetical protein